MSIKENRAGLVGRAIRTWTGELVDLGGRNTLLYYRDLKQGTLDIGPGSGADALVVEGLLSSRPARLSQLFGTDALSTAARRARTIKAKATENFEERGLQTLFLAWGMATWTNARGSAAPAAPVLLRQASLSARGGVAEDFDVSLTGEWEVNPTLLHLLKTDHDVELSPAGLLEFLAQDADPPTPAPLFEHLEKAASSVGGFAVGHRTVLGNFSYAKLPMVLDLETATDTLLASELISAIAGDDEARATVRARHPNVSPHQPDTVPPTDEFLVLDADASQSYAINCAIGGADLVVDGPPGTGKSQTIANLIASLSARGQRILFVAEKRAAIDAVLDRLSRVGLTDLVLDLHEGAGSKRKLAADLAHTLAVVSNTPRPDLATAQDTFVRQRHKLVTRTAALHTPRQPWGVSVYEILSRLPGIPPAVQATERLTGEALARLDGQTFRQAMADLEAFIGLGGLDISEATTPWAEAFIRRTITTADSAQAALEATRALANRTLPATSALLRRVRDECGLREPRSVGDWTEALRLLEGVSATLSNFDAAIFQAPLDELAVSLRPAASGVFSRWRASVFDSQYRRARKTTLALWRTGKPGASSLHAAVVAADEQRAWWSQSSADGESPHLPHDLVAAGGAFGQLCREIEAVVAWTGTTELGQSTIPSLEARLRGLLADTQTLSKLPELTRLHTALANSGLDPLVQEIAHRHLGVDQALACIEYAWLSSILDRISITDAEIGAFDGQAHLRTVATFTSSDRSHIKTAATRVRRAVAENITRTRDEYPKESDIVEHQARLKRGHLPVRQLFQAAPHVLGALRPCWAMSPLIVSQLLPAQRCFDVVIFDEASQVTPADAVGALVRAERAVVAGDPRQLPPTSFFMASGGGEDDEEAEAEELGTPAGTRNMESVLDVMSALLPPPKGTRTLGWHYRSKDERLIAFSNAQPDLYDWALTTFPGVASSDCISHALVPFRPGRVGQEASVGDEVAQVAELVAEHARLRPDMSLGVIAMGIKHANRIEEVLRRARATDPELDAFLAGNASDQSGQELFFVKNLERVQGDERDAIILTIGYGKNSDGRMLYRFGPVNNEGGERRLNVAITRARSRMTVVSSFSAADMDPAKLRSQGAQMLCRYLAYAESGGTDLGHVAKEKPDLNPFERDVEAQLRAVGIPLIPQYGCSGYWIDYAAQHPSRPGQMVLAIECDGASYHSSATARDRDRLRQEHLERLGWTFHRIWSQDWFFRREAETQRALAAYQAAVRAADAGQNGFTHGRTPEAEHRFPQRAASSPPGPPRRVGLCPIGTHRGSIDEYTTTELLAVARWIKSDTLLRTEDELLIEMMRILGFARKGSKITAALKNAIERTRNSSS